MARAWAAVIDLPDRLPVPTAVPVLVVLTLAGWCAVAALVRVAL